MEGASRAFRCLVRDEESGAARLVNKMRAEEVSRVRIDFLRWKKTSENLLLSDRVTYRVGRIAPSTMGEETRETGGRLQKRMRVVKERADKSRRKERINRARPLSTPTICNEKERERAFLSFHS